MSQENSGLNFVKCLHEVNLKWDGYYHSTDPVKTNSSKASHEIFGNQFESLKVSIKIALSAKDSGHLHKGFPLKSTPIGWPSFLQPKLFHPIYLFLSLLKKPLILESMIKDQLYSFF